MLQPDQLRAIIKAQPDIIQHLTSAAKIHAIGEDAYFKAIERDPKEPGRKRKMAYEKKFADLMKRIFDRQKEDVTPQIALAMTAKADDFDLDWTDDEKDKVLALIIEIYGDGIDLFRQEIFDGLSDEFVNVLAKEAAQKYGYDLIKILGNQLDDTTRAAIQNAISGFTEPGVAITDVINKLPFDYDRALRIAVTEITRAYATANQTAGQAYQDQFPDLTIVKTWFTNVDDKVCDICGPLHMTSVKIDDSWGGIDNPPAHVNCRCWASYSSTLGREPEWYKG